MVWILGKCFWILGCVLDSGKCSEFWEVFWFLGNGLDSGKCFVLSLQAECQHTGQVFCFLFGKTLCFPL